MRNLIPFTSLLLSVTALQISPAPAAFIEPYTVNHVTILSATAISIPHELKRQFAGGCPAQHNRCTQAGFGAACCTQGSFCTTDAARMVACCPNGATCTGTIGGAANPTSNGFNPPATTAPISIVSNPYFPFPIIATNFPGGSTQCQTALTACQNNYNVCTSFLTAGSGGGFAVTINAPNGGGVTQAATATRLASAEAVSICQSLRNAACWNLSDAAQCTVFGPGTGGTFVAGNVAPRATAAVGCVAGMMAGLGIGIAGQML